MVVVVAHTDDEREVVAHCGMAPQLPLTPPDGTITLVSHFTYDIIIGKRDNKNNNNKKINKVC